MSPRPPGGGDSIVRSWGGALGWVLAVVSCLARWSLTRVIVMSGRLPSGESTTVSNV
jgi:hypothetical protein